MITDKQFCRNRVKSFFDLYVEFENMCYFCDIIFTNIQQC